MGFVGLVTAGVCALAVGCAFNPTGLPSTDSPGPDGRPGDTDAPGPTVDAPGPTVDAPGPPIDAPCPDVDSDGICDGGDSWLCGPTRPTIGLPRDNGGDPRAAVNALTLGELNNVVSASPGAQLSTGVSVALRDTNNACTDCVDQIELGWAGGSRVWCADFGNPPQGVIQFANNVFTLTVPPAPGRYDLVMHVAQANGCGSNNGARTDGWYPSAPTGPVVGVVCVR
ncbi:MAG: hypothetical protein R3B06_02010 [Kofleriaceae bacterium]